MPIEVVHGSGSSISPGAEAAQAVETSLRIRAFLEQSQRDRQTFEVSQQVQEANLGRIRAATEQITANTQDQADLKQPRLRQARAGADITEQQAAAGAQASDRTYQMAIQFGMNEEQARALADAGATPGDVTKIAQVNDADQRQSQRIQGAQSAVQTLLGPGPMPNVDDKGQQLEGPVDPLQEQHEALVGKISELAAFDPEGAVRMAQEQSELQAETAAEQAKRANVAEIKTLEIQPYADNPTLYPRAHGAIQAYLAGSIPREEMDEEIARVHWLNDNPALNMIEELADARFLSTGDPQDMSPLLSRALQVFMGVSSKVLTAKQGFETIAAIRTDHQKRRFALEDEVQGEERKSGERATEESRESRTIDFTEEITFQGDDGNQTQPIGKIDAPEYVFANATNADRERAGLWFRDIAKQDVDGQILAGEIEGRNRFEFFGIGKVGGETKEVFNERYWKAVNKRAVLFMAKYGGWGEITEEFVREFGGEARQQESKK